MKWNYRVVRTRDPDGDVYLGIHEVYYDDNDKPESATAHPSRVFADGTLGGLLWVLSKMLEGASKPVLDMDVDFPPQPELPR